MVFHPEAFAAKAEKLTRTSDERAERELAELVATLVGEGEEWDRAFRFQEQIEQVAARLAPADRSIFFQRVKEITHLSGWRDAHDSIAEGLNLDQEVERVVGGGDEVRRYGHFIRRPETLGHFRDFFDEQGKPVSFWLPRKYDIRRFVKAAVLAHERSGRTGSVRILDMGGGTGFIAKLLADELYAQGIASEVLVMDPETETIQSAREIFADTDNLRFEEGTSHDAVRRHAPTMDQESLQKMRQLEQKYAQRLERGQEELLRIRATQLSFESFQHSSDVFKSPFGQSAKEILYAAGISEETDIEVLRDALADYYDTRYISLQESCKEQADQIESLCATGGEKAASFDAVLSSWMPSKIDFTRDIRKLAPPVILYALEPGGATGVDYPGRNPEGLGKEPSYATGPYYATRASWDGVAASGIMDAEQLGYRGSYINTSEIQVRNGLEMTEEELEISEPPDEARYPWEESLEELIGRQQVKERQFH